MNNIQIAPYNSRLPRSYPLLLENFYTTIGNIRRKSVCPQQGIAFFDFDQKIICPNDDTVITTEIIHYSYLIIPDDKYKERKLVWWSDICPMTTDLDSSVYRCTKDGEIICPV